MRREKSKDYIVMSHYIPNSNVIDSSYSCIKLIINASQVKSTCCMYFHFQISPASYWLLIALEFRGSVS